MASTDPVSRPRPPASALAGAERFRRRFPGLAGMTHLASNSKGAMSDAAAAAHAEYLASWRDHGTPWDAWIDRYEQLRVAFAGLIGARLSEVALCPSATAALGAIATSVDWNGPRSAIAFDDHTFPSVAHLWHAQSAHGAEVRRVRADARGELPPEAFDAVLDERLRLLSVAHVGYANGHRLDLPAVARRAHDVGAWLVVDDYQSAGSRPLDVRAAGVDVLTTGTLKFLLGSPGVAFLYVAEELLDQLHPRLAGWFGQRDLYAFQIDGHDPALGASRFELGTPAIPSIYDSLAGVELLAAVGLDTVRDWIDGLTAELTARLAAEGFVSATPADPAKRGPQVAIRAHDAEGAVRALAERGVLVTSRDGNVRAAFHYYNTPGDVDALVAGLHAIAPLMERSTR